MKVLVADDSLVYRRMLEVHLKRWGYEPISLGTGGEALQLLLSGDAPRLAILDWMMPEIDGIDVCRQLRQKGHEPYTYIILLTGKDSNEDIVLGLNAGADDYITKPFEAPELEVRMRAGKRIVDLQNELIAAREQLRAEASQDPLTGVLNRGALLKILVRDCSRAEREGTPLATLMVDVDYFKKVNDTFGHSAGDAVLVNVAKRMRDMLRPYDALARFGGEEFLLVLPACDAAAAMVVAERVRAAVAEPPIMAESRAISVTCSIGVSAVSHGHAVSPATLIEAADMALYRAKNAGRNRVVVSDPL